MSTASPICISAALGQSISSAGSGFRAEKSAISRLWTQLGHPGFPAARTRARARVLVAIDSLQPVQQRRNVVEDLTLISTSSIRVRPKPNTILLRKFLKLSVPSMGRGARTHDFNLVNYRTSQSNSSATRFNMKKASIGIAIALPQLNKRKSHFPTRSTGASGLMYSFNSAISTRATRARNRSFIPTMLQVNFLIIKTAQSAVTLCISVFYKKCFPIHLLKVTAHFLLPVIQGHSTQP